MIPQKKHPKKFFDKCQLATNSKNYNFPVYPHVVFTKELPENKYGAGNSKLLGELRKNKVPVRKAVFMNSAKLGWYIIKPQVPNRLTYYQ